MPGLPLLLKAALPSVPVVNQLPGIKKAPLDGFAGLSLDGPEVSVGREHVDAYAKVCGFPVKDIVPLTYPHLLAFPLHMAMMTDPAFPAPAIGTVHLENSVTGHRPIAIGENVVVSASVGAPLPHPKGTLFEFRTEVRAGGRIVWESTSTYLRRGKGTESASSGNHFPDVTAAGPVWRLPADLGRRYAAVSGDHNPIHLYPITAKALGFPRQIAHGMWSKARCIAAIENRLPDAVRVDVAFKKPIILPGGVAFGSTPTPDGYAFLLANPKSGAAHVVGATTAL
ncbi:MAG: MaoC/PaaZ C-terminal domain-containing protein [Nocardioides sp.]